MEPNQKKANGLALIPFAVFVGVYLATGITLNAMGVEMAFYQLSTPIASFIGIIVAFAMFKGNLMTNYLFSFTVVEKKIS
mgnify:FL=1